MALVQVAPGRLEQLFVEPRGQSSSEVADLTQMARTALIAQESEEQVHETAASSRWLGIGGSKLLYVRGVSPVAAAEPIRFARFMIEWVAASQDPGLDEDQEERARAVPGVAWAEGDPDGRVRVIASEGADLQEIERGLLEALPGAQVEWVAPGSEGRAGDPRAQIMDIQITVERESGPSAEVHLMWERSHLRGLGRGESAVVGRHVASARATMDALKPLIHDDMGIEHLQIASLPSGGEVLQVMVIVGQERLVGAVVVRPEQEDQAGARAVLDALNRRLVRLAGQSGLV